MSAERNALFLVLAAAACGVADPDLSPRPASVEPAVGYAETAQDVLVRGERFFVKSAQTGASPGWTADAGFQVSVGAVALEAVTWVDERTLRARVPAGLQPGTYEVVVTGPHGTRGTVSAAYRVVAGRAPALQATLSGPAAAHVGQQFEVACQLRNAGGAALSEVVAHLVVPGATVDVVAAPAAAGVAAGGTLRLAWQVRATAAGALHAEASVSGTDPATGGTVRSPGAAVDVEIVEPGALVSSVAVDRSVVTVGQPVAVEIAVANPGGSAVRGVRPALAVVGDGVAAEIAVEPRDVLAGETVRFALSWRAAGAGAIAFEVAASGVEDRTGQPVEAAPVRTPAIVVEAPPALVATLAAAPSPVNRGQAVAVSMTVANRGEATAADVAPTGLATSGVAATIVTGPVPGSASLAGGASQAFTWTVIPTASGTLAVDASAAGTDGNSGAALADAAAPGAAVRVQEPAALHLTVVSAPAQVSVGQSFDVTVRATNLGDSAARDVAVDVAMSGATGSAVPGLAVIPGGASVDFARRFTATAAGTQIATGSVSAGKDEIDGRALSAAAATARVTVQSPPTLEATLAAAPSPVNRGQTLTVSMTVTNGGEADAVEVAPAGIVTSGVGAVVTRGPTPASALLAGGASQVFSWTLVPSLTGDLALDGSARGKDGNSDAPLAEAAAPRATVRVQEPAALAAVLRVPAVVAPGDLTLTLVVTNNGDAVATGVRPDGPPQVLPGSTSSPTLAATGANPAGNLARGQQATFTWTFAAPDVGQAQFQASASGTDGTENVARTASAAATVQIGEALQVAPAPLGASTFSYVFEHGGWLWLGPSDDGAHAARCDPADCAATLQTFSLSFSPDVTGNTSTNKAPPYASLGFHGCVKDTAGATACGPDNEDGRGFMTSVHLGGQQWILAGGARSAGDLDYVYMSRDPSGGDLPFSYVDLQQQLGPATRGFSSVLELDGRVYLGFPDDGGSRPYGVVLTVPPPTPGLDATSTQAIDLGMHSTALGFNSSNNLMIDAWAGFGGRVYAFNNNGCVVSLRDAPVASADFVPCTPLQWGAKSSILPVVQFDITPADRAVPQAAEWNGRLYVGRNTTTGPQLWSCDPAGGLDSARCEQEEWSLVAPGTLDPLLTDLGQPAGAKITAVAATGSALYVGFDGAAGVQLYRTAVPAASARSDFRGSGGCVVGGGACAPLGGAGFGLGSAVPSIFDARPLDFPGRRRLYVTAGSPSGPVSVWEIPE